MNGTFSVNWRLIFLIGLVLTMALITAHQGQAEQLSPSTMRALPARPHPPGIPTQVSVAAYLIDLIDINEQEKEFAADVFFAFEWHDPRLADSFATTDRMVPIHEIWHPRLISMNRRKLETDFPDMAAVRPDGTVAYRQRALATFNINLDLVDYPFDRQQLYISLVSTGNRPDEIEFLVNNEKCGQEDTFSLAGWTAGELTVRPFIKDIGLKEKVALPGLLLEIDVKRNWQYHLWREVMPLFLIVLMASAIFWIDPKEIGPKIGIATATVFTLIAFYLHLGQVMPPVSYMTRMDTFVIGCTLLVFLSFGVVVTTTYLLGKDQRETALRLDRWSRAIFPLTLALLMGLAFVL